MNKQQATALIRTTFENAFDEDQYLRFLRELFNGQIDESDDRKFDYYGQYIPDSFKDSVRRYKRLGTYTDPDGNEIDLLIVILKRDGSLDRARTMQRNFAAYHLKRREKETAIIAYTTEERSDWRFSMVRREPVVAFSEKGNLIAKDELTPVRRYSFLVGKSERSHTAQQQLFPILLDDKHDPTLDGLEEAFNIETVTKEFFERYKALFLQLKEELDRLTAKDHRVQAEFDAKELDTANFAKKLLGQIVFLYFLQKKGWLGVREGETWGTGPKDFLRQLFDLKWVSYDNFFNDVLEPLFYEALAIERTDNIYPRLKARIPFLNGGLFEPMNNYDWQNTDILIDNGIFEDIFDTFDLYNFTVREDEPLEKEVAVDPEMLGKVFENLLEVTDRKSKGAFYTPREIVHYMCQESLINYLATAMGDTVPRDDLATFIRVGELAVQNDTAKEAGTVSYTYQMPASIRTHAKKLDAALASIKICDPAIGSGAFPVGMMQEIIKAREVLTTYIGESESRTTYNFKRQAIQESIYGVDIDPGAIDIAKLRLWLSLVVDEDDYHNIKPLPNLDYKIVCGNSLLSVRRDLFNDALFKELEALKTTYFDETNPQEKQKQRAEIDALIAQLTGDHSTFDMQIYFSEVFHGNKGFDVVIGNPPYVRGEAFVEQKDSLKSAFLTVFTRAADLYVYFFALGFRTLKPSGQLAFITSNKYLRTKYAKKLREFFANNITIRTLIDFGDLHVFDAAAYPCIFIGANQAPLNNAFLALAVTNLSDVNNLSLALQNKAAKYSQDLLKPEGWQISDSSSQELNNKIKHCSQTLEKYVRGQAYYGIKSGLSSAFMIDEDTRQQLIIEDPRSDEIIKPCLRGREIQPWRINWRGDYIIYTYQGIKIKNYPAIYRYLEQFKPDLEPKKDRTQKRGRKPGTYQWYEMQFNPSDLQLFERPKILYQKFQVKPAFVLDTASYYTNDAVWIISSEDYYLLGILNSTMGWYEISRWCTAIQNGYQLIWNYFKNVRIPNASDDLRQQIASLAQQCLDTAKDNPNKLSTLEAELNQLVYQAYGLTDDEIALIEGRE